MPRHRLILLAHGSVDPNWIQPFRDLASGVEKSLGTSSVRLAFLQFATPTLADAVAEAANDRVDRLKVFPVFLAPGAHIARDIPDVVSRARAEHPGIEIELLPAVGTDPRMGSLLKTLALEAAAPPW